MSNFLPAILPDSWNGAQLRDQWTCIMIGIALTDNAVQWLISKHTHTQAHKQHKTTH